MYIFKKLEENIFIFIHHLNVYIYKDLFLNRLITINRFDITSQHLINLHSIVLGDVKNVCVDLRVTLTTF